LNSTNKQNLMLGLFAIVILAAIAWVSLRNTSEPVETAASLKSADVLSPTLFTDATTRAAYQVAKDIPEVLEQLPCFCGCMTGFGHKNNLFCFKDQHGAACTMCQDIALEARKMHDQGMSIAQIQDHIKAKFAPTHQ